MQNITTARLTIYELPTITKIDYYAAIATAELHTACLQAGLARLACLCQHATNFVRGLQSDYRTSGASGETRERTF